MSIQQHLEQRIAELEMKVTFQETVIEELNQALIEQQFWTKCSYNSVMW